MEKAVAVISAKNKSLKIICGDKESIDAIENKVAVYSSIKESEAYIDGFNDAKDCCKSLQQKPDFTE